jgi:hypothetical protein
MEEGRSVTNILDSDLRTEIPSFAEVYCLVAQAWIDPVDYGSEAYRARNLMTIVI